MINWKKKIRQKAKQDERRTTMKPNVFHPSWMGYCPRSIYLSKLGAKDLNDYAGSMRVGTIFHKWIEKEFDIEGVKQEKGGALLEDGIKFVGTCDAMDDEAIYDFKTQRYMNYVKDSAKEQHIDQLTIYMRMFNKSVGKLVYISKGDVCDIISYKIAFDENRFQSLINKAKKVEKEFRRRKREGNLSDIPFDKCDDFCCENEKLRDPIVVNKDDRN